MHFQSISRSRASRLAPLLALALLGTLPALAHAQESDSSSALAVRSTTSASTLFSSDSSAASSRLSPGMTGVEGSFGFVAPSTSVSLLFARKQGQGTKKGQAADGTTPPVAGTSLGTTGLVVVGGTLLIGGGLLAAGLSGGLGNGGPSPSLIPIPAVPELGTVVGLGGLLVLGALLWRQRRKAAEQTEWQA